MLTSFRSTPQYQTILSILSSHPLQKPGRLNLPGILPIPANSVPPIHTMREDSELVNEEALKELTQQGILGQSGIYRVRLAFWHLSQPSMDVCVLMVVTFITTCLRRKRSQSQTRDRRLPQTSLPSFDESPVQHHECP